MRLFRFTQDRRGLLGSATAWPRWSILCPPPVPHSRHRAESMPPVTRHLGLNMRLAGHLKVPDQCHSMYCPDFSELLPVNLQPTWAD